MVLVLLGNIGISLIYFMCCTVLLLFDRCLLSTGNAQGQVLTKINLGDILDNEGDRKGALDAFEESYRYGFFSQNFLLTFEGHKEAF